MMKNLKQLRSIFKFVLGGSKPSAGPFKIQWDILYECNSRCITCDRWHRLEGESTIPFERKKRFLDELAELNSRSVIFSGGEPFLSSEIFDLIKYAKKVGLTTGINSNGLLINNEKIAEKIVSSGLDLLHLSLDGAKPQTHDYIRGVKGGFEKTFKAIVLLKEMKTNKPKIFIKYTLNNKNVSEMISLVKMCKDAGVDGINIEPAHNCNEMRFNVSQELNLSRKNIPLFKKELKVLMNDYGNMFPLMEEYFNNFVTFIENPLALYRYRCVAAYSTVQIHPNGNVYPCPMAFEKMGNLTDSSFKDIWFSDKANEIRAKIKNGKHPICWFTCIAPANIFLSHVCSFKFYKLFKPKLIKHILYKMVG